MSAGYRVLFIGALAAALFVTFGLGVMTGTLGTQPPQTSTQQNQTQASRQQTPTPSQQANEYQQPCRKGDPNRNSDLCAQWEAADAARDSARYDRWQLWVGVVGAAGLLAALGLTLDANGISRRTAKRQLRAYMGINKYDLTPYQLGVIGTGKFLIAMKNFGQTPAIALTTRVSYAIRPWVDADTRPDDWDFEAPGFPIDIAPGAPMFREINFSQHAIEQMEELQSGDAGLWVKFCAAYEDVFGRHHEQITFFYSRRTTYRSGIMLPINQSRETTTKAERQ
jgi:hypothetical protein